MPHDDIDTGSEILNLALKNMLGERDLQKSSSCCCMKDDLVGDLYIAITTVKGQMQERYVNGVRERRSSKVETNDSLSRIIDLLSQIRGIVPYKILLGLDRIATTERESVRERCKKVLAAWLKIEVVSDKVQEFFKDDPTIESFGKRVKSTDSFDDLSQLLSHLAIFDDWNKTKMKWNQINRVLESDLTPMGNFFREGLVATAGTVKALELVDQTNVTLQGVRNTQSSDDIWFGDEILRLGTQKENIVRLGEIIVLYKGAVSSAGKSDAISSDELENIRRNAQRLMEFLQNFGADLWLPYFDFVQKLKWAMKDSSWSPSSKIGRRVQELEELLKLQIGALEYLKVKAPIELAVPLKSESDKLVEFVREINQSLVSMAISLDMKPEGSEDAKEKAPVVVKEVNLEVDGSAAASSHVVQEDVVVMPAPEISVVSGVVSESVVVPATKVSAEKQPQAEEKSEPKKEPTIEEQLDDVQREMDVTLKEAQNMKLGAGGCLAYAALDKEMIPDTTEARLAKTQQQLKALKMYMKSVTDRVQADAKNVNGAKSGVEPAKYPVSPRPEELDRTRQRLRSAAAGSLSSGDAREAGYFGKGSVRERIAKIEKLNGSAGGSPTFENTTMQK